MKKISCPYCSHEGIWEFEEDYFCGNCSWNSIAARSENKPLVDFFKGKNSSPLSDEKSFQFAA